MIDVAENHFYQLKAYCEAEKFMGWDPFDGLNSAFFKKMGFLADNRYARLAWIQLFKRSPLNLRGVLSVEKQVNPKGLGLFLSGYCNLFAVEPSRATLDIIKDLTNEILAHRSPGWSGDCWGYNFDWQARAFFQPKGTPTVVASSFVANALLDAYEITKEDALLHSARSTCDFVLKDLNRTPGSNGSFCFSYSPLDTSVVYNASLLGCRLLARVFAYTKENHLQDEARRAVLFCIDRQKPNGSWAYGDLPFHSWIDSFHTGYNLECLAEYAAYTKDAGFQQNLEAGLQYYLNNFFTSAGEPKYYNNALYPIDIHAPAQLIVTLCRLGAMAENEDLVDCVLRWTLDNMQDPRGFFYYQRKKFFSSRIPFMRWAQGWMFYGLSYYLRYHKE